MFAELLVWFADPARSLAPHLDGAHFSSSGLSETGPFSVWAPELPEKIESSAISTIGRTVAYLMGSLLSRSGSCAYGERVAVAYSRACARAGSVATSPSR